MPISNDWVKIQEERMEKKGWEPLEILRGAGLLTADDEDLLQAARLRDNLYADGNEHEKIAHEIIKRHSVFLSKINQYNPVRRRLVYWLIATFVSVLIIFSILTEKNY